MQPKPSSDQRSNPDDFRLQTATELLHLIRQEAGILEHFDGPSLLQLLPRKELLSRLLHQRMLAAAGPDRHRNSDGRTALSVCLQEIQAQNDRNRRFIENSLEYWRDLVGFLLPSTYNRTGDESPHQHHSALRGVRINREV